MSYVESPVFSPRQIGYRPRLTFGKREASHMVIHVSLVEKFAALTGASDQEIARLLNIARSTAQAYRTGRLEENLNERQKANLVTAARAFRQQVYEAVAELEMFS